MDQAAARGRPAENEAPRKEYHFIEGDAGVTLQMRILVVGNLAFRLIFDGHATVVMGNRRSVLGDMTEEILFSCWIDDGQSVLVLDLFPAFGLVGSSPFPRGLRGQRLGFRRCGDVGAGNDG